MRFNAIALTPLVMPFALASVPAIAIDTLALYCRRLIFGLFGFVTTRHTLRHHVLMRPVPMTRDL